MKERHRIRASLLPKLVGYWGERVLTQILYLEECNLAHGARFESLLDEVVQALDECLDGMGALEEGHAYEIEEIMSAASDFVKKTTVECVAHAHLDMNWMWRYDETVMITVDTLKTMLKMMEEYPGFTFSQSQASVYRIIELYAPEMIPEIKQRIKEGRWEVIASTWVETDKNLPSGENQTRHLLYTRRYLKKLLDLTDDMFQIDFEPDTFGHNMNVPEVLASGGVKYYYHCRGYDGHHMYRWRARSGAEVTVLREPTWYNEAIGRDSFLHIPALCKAYNLDRMLHVYGVGNHGGGATRRDIERIIDYNTWPAMPTLRFGRYIDFFKYMDGLELPVVEHELNFIFDGCYTSQSRIKKGNHAAEAALYKAEALNAFSHLCGAHPYDAGAFAGAWEGVLFNTFHDILPGSCVMDAKEHAMGLYQQALAHAGTRLSAAARGIASKLNTAALLPESDAPKDSVAEGAGAGYGVEGFEYTAYNAAGGNKRAFVLFNPTQASARSSVMLTVWDWGGDIANASVTDENGYAVESEVLDSEPKLYWWHSYFRILVSCEIEPFGYKTLLLDEDFSFRSSAKMFNPEELSDPRSLKDENYTLENEYVKAVFDPSGAAIRSFVDKKTGAEYVNSEHGCLLRYIEEQGREGGSAWTVGRHKSVTPLTQCVNATEVKGKLRQTLSFETRVNQSVVNTEVSLDKHSRVLEFACTCDWRERGGLLADGVYTIPQLSFHVPLSYPCGRYEYDTAFGAVSRGPLSHDVPGLSYAYAPKDGGGGLMLISGDKYGFRSMDDSLSLTLIRSTYDPDFAPECYKHSFSFGLGLAGASAGERFEMARAYVYPAMAVPAERSGGDMPPSGSFVRQIDGDAVISTVKMPEDGGQSLVIRAFDVSGKDSDSVFEFFLPVKSAAYVDAHECEAQGSGLKVSGNRLTARFPAYATVSLKVTF